jgi:hypothetical protein
MEKASDGVSLVPPEKRPRTKDDERGGLDIWERAFWPGSSSIAAQERSFCVPKVLRIPDHIIISFRKALGGKEIQQRALRDSNPRPTD